MPLYQSDSLNLQEIHRHLDLLAVQLTAAVGTSIINVSWPAMWFNDLDALVCQTNTLVKVTLWVYGGK